MNDQDQMVRDAADGMRANASGWIGIPCPVCPTRGHSPSRSQTMRVRESDWRYMCFRCGARGYACEWDDDAPRVDARAVVGEETGPAFEWPNGPAEFVPLWTDEARHSVACQGPIKYLTRRGIRRTACAAANIGACFDGRFVGRVVVPHMNTDGTWWGWSARSYTKHRTPKYLYPSGMTRRMYNDDALFAQTTRPVVLVEGTFDAVRFLPDAVACLGKPTNAHERALACRQRPVVVALDGDSWEEGRELVRRLNNPDEVRPRAYALRMPAGIDPGSIDRDEMVRLVVQTMRTGGRA